MNHTDEDKEQKGSKIRSPVEHHKKLTSDFPRLKLVTQYGTKLQERTQ